MPDADERQPPPIAVSAATLPALAERATVPDFDRGALARSIVHIGVGGFHRAHLATYINDLCASGDTAWSIVGAGLLPNDRAMADALRAQDFLYTLIARDEQHTELDVIGSIIDFVLADEDPELVVAEIANPATQVLSMTITEGGYPVDDVTGNFVADRSPAGSVFDVVARGLDARRRQAGSPITVMSCDNVMANGRVARTATLGAAATIGEDLVEWIGQNVSFPNSMVDRITPVTTASDIAWLESACGITDRWPVVAEPFRQWVVEDDFAGMRLPLEELDVIIAADIEPYELTKLRLLNAGHSCLAYLAALDGHTSVDGAMADPRLRRFVDTLLHLEAKPTLPAAQGIDLDDYIATLLDRFSNPQVGDQIARLCFDGSSKFPKFLLPTIRAQLAGNGDVALSAMALAGWCEYLAAAPRPLANDPLLSSAEHHAAGSLTDPAAFLDFAEVFGTDLRADARFVDAFTHALTLLRQGGVQSALAVVLEGIGSGHGEHND